MRSSCQSRQFSQFSQSSQLCGFVGQAKTGGSLVVTATVSGARPLPFRGFRGKRVLPRKTRTSAENEDFRKVRGIQLNSWLALCGVR